MVAKILIFLIGLLIPSSKPCISTVAQWHSDTAVACLQVLPSLEPKIKFANFFLRSPQISEFLILNSEFKPFLPHLDYLLGKNKPTSYLILLQNNYEMRANGGFFGSYAKIVLSPKRLDSSNPGVLEFSPEISFQDIYVPDGALSGHVDPPAPIQNAFKQGWFKLRDSDWNPDFPTTATTIRWFFEKGGEINPDFLITLNLSTIEKIVSVIGEIRVPEYDLTLNSDNLYSLLQGQSEMKAFQGSTQKKDVITAAGNAVIKKLPFLKYGQYVQLVQILLDQLNHGNLLVNSTNPDLQKILEEKDWAGKIVNEQCKMSNCLTDSVLLVEANLGANKANCCVERKTSHTITKNDTEISHLINLTFTNKSPLENPSPPRFYGGNYISYLRFYLPENAKNIRLTAQPTLPKSIQQYPAPFDGLTNNKFDLSSFKCEMSNEQCEMREVGFFHLTAAGTSSAVQLSYDLPLDNLGGYPIENYQLNLLKQHGLETSPQEINLFGNKTSTNLEKDYSTLTTLQ